MINNKFNKLLKKNSEKDNTILTQVYDSNVNKEVIKKYNYGEEHAILRKTLNEIICLIEKSGVDTTKFNEFKEYNKYVELCKEQVKIIINDINGGNKNE